MAWTQAWIEHMTCVDPSIDRTHDLQSDAQLSLATLSKLSYEKIHTEATRLAFSMETYFLLNPHWKMKETAVKKIPSHESIY